MRFIMNLRSASLGAGVALTLASVQPILSDEGAAMRFGGAGWLGYGAVAASIDTVGGNDIVGKPMISSGAQVLLQMMPNENLEIQAGIGAGGGHRLSGSVKTSGGYSPFGVGPYVAQANFTYHGWKEEESALFFRGGLFAFDYAKENQNLGLYLLRGPVYPGFLISGFETKHVLPVANTLGLHLHHRTGIFRQDFLLMVETDFYPYYDVSPVYIATMQPGSAFRLSAGINFHHLIPVDPELTTDTTSMRYVVGSTGPAPDTVQLSAKGIKLMMNAALDLKAVFGLEGSLGPEDLKLYGEAAVIGLGGLIRDDIHFGGAPRLKKNSKAAYEELYGPISQRMPMMVGFNLPAFGFLDRLALEVQHYGAPFGDDLAMFNATKARRPGVIPMDIDSSITRDNLKWSLYGSKVIQNHIKISVQAASDHFRPGIFTGYGDNNPPKSTAVLFRPQDWYWMTKIAYFF